METQQTPAVSETTATPPLPEGADALDARASVLLEQIATEQKSSAREAAHPEPAEGEPAKETPAAKADAPAEQPAAAKTADQIAEERRQRIEARNAELRQMAEQERAKVDASRQRKQERAPEPQTPPQQAAGIAITDAATFFQAAEKLSIPPHELAAWLTQQQDPAKAAKHAAKEVLSPVEQKLKELEEKTARWEAEQRQREEQARVSQLVEQNHAILASHLDSVKDEAPLAAAFRSNAPEDYRAAVENICDALPPGFTAQDVVDQLEERLTKLHRALQFQGAAAPSAPTSSAKPKPPAAVKANVGNRLAAERATTVEDDGDDAEGDLEDRARRLKARLAVAG